MTTDATKEKSKTKVLTPYFRVSFPSVFTPKAAMNPGDKAKYEITMLFPKTADLSEMKTAALFAIQEKWGADKAKWPKGLRTPFRDGTEKEYDGYGADVVFVKATALTKPGLVDQSVTPIIAPEEFYAGCWARATVNAFAYDQKGNRGVSFGLGNIQKWKDDEPFGGKTKPENDFDAITVPATSSAKNAEEDPLAGI